MALRHFRVLLRRQSTTCQSGGCHPLLAALGNAQLWHPPLHHPQQHRTVVTSTAATTIALASPNTATFVGAGRRCRASKPVAALATRAFATASMAPLAPPTKPKKTFKRAGADTTTTAVAAEGDSTADKGGADAAAGAAAGEGGDEKAKEGGDGDGGDGQEKKEGEEEYSGGSDWMYWAAGAVGAILISAYTFVDTLQHNENFRTSMDESMPQVTNFVREWTVIDPPTEEDPVIPYDPDNNVTAVMLTKSLRRFLVSAHPEASKRDLEELLLRNECEVDDDAGPWDPSDEVADIGFLEKDGSVPRGMRGPTEHELIAELDHLQKQEAWATQHKKTFWWFTDNRRVMRQYIKMLQAQRETSQTMLDHLRGGGRLGIDGELLPPVGHADKAAAAAGAGVDGAETAPPAGTSSDNFSPAEAFAGARPGFVFKRGDAGLGYYRDTYHQEAHLRA